MHNDIWKTVESSLAAIGNADSERLVVFQAKALENYHVPPFPPSLPVILLDINACSPIEKLLAGLRYHYHPEHLLQMVSFTGKDPGACRVSEIPLSAVKSASSAAEMVHLYLPPLAEATAFESFQDVVARLRAPDGCPWDKKQTHQTLRSHLLSETYEVLSALDENDPADMCEEFGDLLLQIVLNAQIAAEAGEFQMKDVLMGVNQKIVHRHPHVFGDLSIDDEKGVLQNWERLKAAERAAKQIQSADPEKPKGMLDGVPLALPALVQSQEYLERVERVGIPWLSEEEIVRQIGSLALQIQKSAAKEESAALLKRMVFLAANQASIHHLDAEALLREANGSIRTRVQSWEQRAREEDSSLSASIPEDEKKHLWDLNRDGKS